MQDASVHTHSHTVPFVNRAVGDAAGFWKVSDDQVTFSLCECLKETLWSMILHYDPRVENIHS